MYCLYSENKKQIIKSCFNSNIIKFRSVLLAGEVGTGKKITAFHIVKNYFNLKTIFEIFFNTNFLYLLKDPPAKEINVLLNLIEETTEPFLKQKYFKKLLFLFLRVCSQLIYNIAEYKKVIPDELIENITIFFYNIKNINLNNLDSSNFKHIKSISKDILYLVDNFKSDYIYINEIHKIQEWINLKAKTGKKIIFIENIEKMGVDSANAFLKTLEEPPEDLLFILTTNNKFKILPTIRSRCALYNIDNLTGKEFRNILIEEWGEKYCELFDKYPDNFNRFLELLEEDKFRIDYVKNANNFIKLLFLKNDDISEIFLILSRIKKIKGFDKFIDELLYILRKSKKTDLFDFSNTVTDYQIENIEKFLDYLLWANKNINYSLENGLLYLYLNRYRIFAGDFDGEKFFL